jgi:hypothetical protein
MAHVVFALGTRPGLSEDEALELAELLARKRSLAAQSASRKILLEANRDPDQGEKSKDIELSREELEASRPSLPKHGPRRSCRDTSISEAKSIRRSGRGHHVVAVSAR